MNHIGLRENLQETIETLYIWGYNPWFPVDFPLNQSIDRVNKEVDLFDKKCRDILRLYCVYRSPAPIGVSLQDVQHLLLLQRASVEVLCTCLCHLTCLVFVWRFSRSCSDRDQCSSVIVKPGLSINALL